MTDSTPPVPFASFPEIVERNAGQMPDRPFLRTTDGATVTWSELDSLGRTWAGRFCGLGVNPGEIVATMLDAGLEALAIWLGLSRLGAVDAAINGEFHGRMLAHAIRQCGAAVIVTDPSYLEAIVTVARDLPQLRTVLVLGIAPARTSKDGPFAVLLASDLDRASPASLPGQPRIHDIACITYTSGTTGPSKAVMLPWGQLHCINLGTFPYRDLGSDDVFYCTTTHAHFGSKSMPYLAAMVGGQVVVRPRFSRTSFWRDIEAFGVTTASLVGTMAAVLARSEQGPREGSTLRNLFMAPLGSAYRAFNSRFGTRICTVYNSSEGGIALRSGWNPENDRTVGQLRAGYPGFEVRLVDEHDQEVRDGQAGELIVRSGAPWTMSAGYHNDPQATAAAWRNGWFHTGDVMIRRPTGDYEFIDRLKDAIRRRGENISSSEVEAEALTHPGIVECAAVGVPGELDDEEVMLFAVIAPNATVTHSGVAVHLRKRLPRFMVPRYLEFLDELPKTAATYRIAKDLLRKRGIGPETWDIAKEFLD